MAAFAIDPPPAAQPALRPPLKWAGGKRWLLPRLRELWAPYADARLVEPFAGGLAVSLGLRPGRALISDINAHAMNFYRQLQRGLAVGIELENNEECYYRHRAAFNALIAGGQSEGAEAAEYFYYLNRTGYNGLCRFNRAGRFNVPFGRYERIAYTRDFSVYREPLSGWELQSGDFAALELGPADFVYADPPYDVEFTSYSPQAFGWPEQVRLAELLARHPGPVVLSNQATARIRELYLSLGFTLEEHAAPRMIACNGDRTRATEVLATRNLSCPSFAD